MLGHPNGPFREVARVDELHGVARSPRCENGAAAVDAHRPIREPIRFVARPDDQSRADDHGLAGKPLFRLGFREGLEGAVEFEIGCADRFHGFLHCVRAAVFRQRAGFVEVGLAIVGIDRNRGNEDVAIDVTLEDFRGVAYPNGQGGGVVDCDVPFATLERIEFSISIADQLLDAVGQLAGVGPAAIENRNLVAAT